jgi:hypothetical protein
MTLAGLDATSSSPERHPSGRNDGMTSGARITPLRRADIPELSQFLIGGSGVPATSALFSHEVVLRKSATSRTGYAIGGTEKAQAVLPKLGFEQKRQLAIFRKVLASLHRLGTTDQGLFRNWACTVKDAVSVWRASTPPMPQIFELRLARTFTEEIDCSQ